MIKAITVYPYRQTRRGRRGVGKKGNLGVSLIEVLISILVLAIGVLGMAGLQISGKQTNFEALQRSTATHLAQDMVERMRANPEGLEGYEADQTSAPGSCVSSACSPDDLAKWDRWEWKQALAGSAESGKGGLASPAGCVVHSDGYVTVTITWTGMTEIKHVNANTCAGLAAGDSSDKRVLEITAFISE